EAVRFACGSDPFRRKQHVDPAAGPEIEDGLAWLEGEQSGWVAAAERRCHGIRRQAACLCIRVQIRRHRVAAAAPRWAATTGVDRPLPHRIRDGAVFLTNRLLDV